jgi:hypothetical protein
MKTRIYIDRPALARNKEHGMNKPAVIVERGPSVIHCMEVELHGPSKIVYDASRGPGDGTTVWMETEHPITIIGEGCAQ